LIIALIAVPIYFLFVNDDGSRTSQKASNPSADELRRAATDPAAALKLLSHRVAAPQQGIEVLYPNGWRGDVVNGAVRVTSNDDSTGIAITTKGTARQAKSVFRVAVRGVRGGFRGAKVTYPRRQPPIAGLPAGEAIITGVRNGVRQSLLLAVARGARVSYVITFLAHGAGQLGIANLIFVRGVTLSG
jgi:hypothetical protein